MPYIIFKNLGCSLWSSMQVEKNAEDADGQKGKGSIRVLKVTLLIIKENWPVEENI